MTTIAYHKRLLAADTLAHGKGVSFTMNKIHVLDSSDLEKELAATIGGQSDTTARLDIVFAGSGRVEDVNFVKAWLRDLIGKHRLFPKSPEKTLSWVTEFFTGAHCKIGRKEKSVATVNALLIVDFEIKDAVGVICKNLALFDFEGRSFVLRGLSFNSDGTENLSLMAAIGGGAGVAVGVMLCGKTPIEAIAVVGSHFQHTGKDCNYINFPENGSSKGLIQYWPASTA